MNSLPHWFGKNKKRKKIENLSPPILDYIPSIGHKDVTSIQEYRFKDAKSYSSEINDAATNNYPQGLEYVSSYSPGRQDTYYRASVQDLLGLEALTRPISGLSNYSLGTELTEENMYVNGQVPRGHFTEYFQHRDDRPESITGSLMEGVKTFSNTPCTPDVLLKRTSTFIHPIRGINEKIKNENSKCDQSENQLLSCQSADLSQNYISSYKELELKTSAGLSFLDHEGSSFLNNKGTSFQDNRGLDFQNNGGQGCQNNAGSVIKDNRGLDFQENGGFIFHNIRGSDFNNKRRSDFQKSGGSSFPKRGLDFQESGGSSSQVNRGSGFQNTRFLSSHLNEGSDIHKDPNLGSFDDIGSPNTVGLPSPQTGIYYNVRMAHSSRSCGELSTPNLCRSGSSVRPKSLQVETPSSNNNYDEIAPMQEFLLMQVDQPSSRSSSHASLTNPSKSNFDNGSLRDSTSTVDSIQNQNSDSEHLGSDNIQSVSLHQDQPGNHYGTPRPTGDSSLRPEVAPGQHPSSEGKRRRNRSNVEAMAAKHMEAEQENNGGSPDSGATDQTSLPKQQGNSNDAGDGLGPLPHNWERACTDKGEQYFIDHNTGTSHWLDPRLSRVQKRRPEDCEDNELPFGWERIDDPHYGIYYIDHVNRRTQYENPVLAAKAANHSADGIVLRSPPSPPPAPSTYPRPSKPENDRPFFTRDPGLLRGERLQAKLVKSTRGLGFTIVGGDDSEEEFLQIKSVVPNGPAWLDGRLKTGDVLVFVNGQCVLGFTHHDMVSMFQNINPSEVVKLDVCRGYPLPFDPDDPNTEIVTTVAVNSPDQGDWNHLDKQRTEHDGTASMPDMWRSQSGLEERMRPGSADLLLEPSMNGLDISGGADDPRFGNQDHVTIPIVKGGMGFGFTIADSVFGQKVKKILDRPRCKNLNEGDILVEINNINVQNMNHTNVVQVLKDCPRGQEAAITIQRGNSLNLTKNKFKKKEENGGMRPKSGFLFRSKTPTAELFATQEKEIVPMRPKTPIVDTRNMAQKNWNGELNQNLSPFSRNDFSRASLGVGGRTEQHGSFDMLSEQLSMVGLKGHPAPRSHSPGRELDQPQYQYNYNYQHQNGFLPNGYDSGYGYSGYNGDYPAAPQVQGYSPNGNGYRAGSLPRGRKDSSSFEQSDQLSNNMRWSGRRDGELEMVVVLLRHDSGFGFRIVGGTEEGSQVSIGHIVSGGAAHMDGRLFSGDEIVAVDGHSVLGASHHVVVEMMGSAAQRGQVQLTIRRRQEGYREGYPYDVTVSRLENEGFGFVIISSVSRAGSTIGRIIPGSPAERCGRLQVGDRILAVNHVDINTLHHEKIINIIKESGYSVTLTVGPPLDDTSSTASTSHREDQEVGAHLGDEDQYFAVELGRGNRGFGFSIRGGREFHSMPLFVLRMAVDGPATADGRLRVGDQLIEINGQSTRNMTHGEAIETIKNGGTAVRLLVKRGKAPPPAILDQTSLSPTSPTPLPHTRPVSSLSQPTNGNGIPPNHEGQGNGNGPVSHSSPRYPPHTYFQQPYWGYHQQSVE